MGNVKILEVITSALIECVYGYDCLWNVSATVYHKNYTRQAALRSI